MQPILFKIGSLPVYSWGAMLSIAILIGTYIAVKWAKEYGISADTIMDLVIVLIIGGLVGGRLFYVVVYDPRFYLANPLEILFLWRGGLVYYGALIGGFLAGVWFVRKKQLPFWKLSDIVTPPLALGYGIVRVGCFLNGCCYGKPTSSAWGVLFPYVDNLYRYPTQLYSAAFGIAIFLFLLWFRAKKAFHGQLFLIFLIIYGVERIIVEAFRENLLVWGNLTVSQLISIFVIISAGYFYYRKTRRSEDKA